MEACCSRFTAAEGGARLAAAASAKNTLAVEYSSFIATRLVHEEAYKIRGSLFEGRQRSLYVTRPSRVSVVAYELHILTDLSIAKSVHYDDIHDWKAELDKKEVLVCTSPVLKRILEEEIIMMSNINVLILDSSHLVCKDDSLQYIMKLYKECEEEKRPRILALTYPLFPAIKKETNQEAAERNINTEEIQKIDETEEKSKSYMKDYNDSADLNTKIMDAIAENKDSTTDTTALKNEITDSKTEITDSKTENTDPKIEITDSETEITDSKTENAESKIKITDSKTEILESKTANIDSKNKVTDCKSKIIDVKNKITNAKTEVTDSNTEITDSKSEITKPDITKSETENIESETKIPEKKNEIVDSTTEIETTKEVESSINKDLKVESKDREKVKKVVECEQIGVYENLDDFDMYEKLEWKIEQLEKELCCQMDLAEDIDGGKRLSATISKPKELIVEYSAHPSTENLPEVYIDLEAYMKDTVNEALDFINQHRYDPTEIYGEDMYEEFKNIPDPTIEPKHVFSQFLYVLEQLGPYAADKAAFSLLTRLEKLKIKVPYERHFLLLCLCTSVFIKIRCYTDIVLSKFESDWDKIKLFSTPKVLRLSEILEKFQPPELTRENKKTSLHISHRNDANKTDSNIKTKDMLKEIEKCDFISLGVKIEDKVNIYEANLKEIVDLNVDDLKKTNDTNTNEIDSDQNKSNINQNDIDSIRNETNIVQNKIDCTQNEINETQKSTDKKFLDIQSKGGLGFSRRTGHRTRGRGRVPRTNAARVQQMQQNPDALCGIVFMKEALMAKIMFMLIVDMSRCQPKLSYLCAQYCAVENPADPGTEPRECQRQGKKQEDVLKKFRMHECNLLLATSALEEGIDLPRCNLVLRWDVPASYRSYGLCRGRARAPRAACALLSSDAGNDTDTLLHNVAVYRELDQIISRKCGCGIQDEPPQTEEDHADVFTLLIKPYTPNDYKSTDRNTNDSDKSRQNDENSEPLTKITKKDSICEKNYENNVRISENFTEICEESEEVNINANLSDKKHETDVIEHLVKSSRNSEEILKMNVKCEERSDDGNKNDVKAKFDDMSIENETNILIIDNELTKVNEKIVDEQNICEETSLINYENDNKGDLNRTNINNLICNKCKNKRDSVSIECPCVSVRTMCDIGVNTTDSNKSKSDKKNDDHTASVDLSTAIALINRYCGKLPSDTFTRLAPQWWMEQVQLPVRDSAETRTAYICTLRLPLNCPVKYNIVGHPMPTRVLARRMVALQACRILHKSGELDNQLLPIGKENFKAAELETTTGIFASSCGDTSDANDAARPGTTKRRQYYFKRTAWAFTDCQPVVDTSDSEVESAKQEMQNADAKNEPAVEVKTGTKRNMLYAIVSKLWCALPERYNTRGRRLHAPQNASQAIGILMARDEPDSLQIPAFPVYTRSGEVRVSVEHVPDADVRMSPRRGRLVRRFMRFVFAEVLRVRRRGMKLQSEGSAHNNYYIVPTIKTISDDGTEKVDIDWPFLEQIYQHTEEKKHSEIEKPILWHHDEEELEDVAENTVEERVKERDGKVKKMENPLLATEEVFVFDAERYREAVVTPWYRNQDQPQFFLVAEICWNLTPDSAFPSATHSSFRDYYSSKYGVTLTQCSQPLLDVDHTSARLNLLTPRYVNRKGVALPVSSERTRRAKRDRLDQKQILVPELCRVHPFAAPLWFATVALPCVLYRINALLIADEIRRAVAIDVGLGIPKIDENTAPGFQWPPLDFGWSLAEVLSADSEKNDRKKEEGSSSVNDDKETEEKEEQEELNSEKDSEKNEEDGAQFKETEKTINEILQKEVTDSGFEIGTWSNEMASSIPEEFDEYMEPLPSNITFCTSASGGTNWLDPIEKPKSMFNPSKMYSMADSDCSYMTSDFDTDDSDLNSDVSDDDTDTSGFFSSKNSNVAMGVRIEYKTAHEAEAIDLERKKVNPAPVPDELDDSLDRSRHERYIRAGAAPPQYVEKFRKSVAEHKKEIVEKGFLIQQNAPITDILPEPSRETHEKLARTDKELDDIATRLSKINFQVDNTTAELINEIFPFGSADLIQNGQVNLESIEKNKRLLLDGLKKTLSMDEVKKLNCFSMVDVDIDSSSYVNEKVVNVGFDTKDAYKEKITKWNTAKEFKPYYQDGKGQGKEFDFDYQPELEGHPGPSPSVILQALTMSNANDGINLERLETIGDSFLKFAITAYLYSAHPTVHEGKLSHMRSKQVSNLNLYRLGRNKRLGARMIASKFEPHDNWLPPCHKPPSTLHPRLPESQDNSNPNQEIPSDSSGCFIPYNLITQHSIPDKSIADCVEALIGAYLLECGPRGALLFMSWLGIRVLPRHELPLPRDHPFVVADRAASEKKPQAPPSPKRKRHDATDSDTDCSDDGEEPWQHQQEFFPETDWTWPGRAVGSLRPYRVGEQWLQPIFGELKAPPSPLLRYIADPEGELDRMLSGYDALERTLQYRFKDRSLLLQALTHASHQQNRLTDCYQRLEFLGDAILDYLITRHLYEDPRRHSPGALTDLRSALVNNTIFATLAARHGFHKYFRHMSPGLNEVLTKYVKIQEENGHSISEEHYLIQEDEMEQAEDVEVPKALGDLFESVAGAIFLDSGMSLGAVWKSYVTLMGAELEAFSAAAPKSPVRELLEAEPDTAKFGKPERLADGRRVRVCVEVFGRGAFKGVGRNYRIAKGTAARAALRHLRIHRAR